MSKLIAIDAGHGLNTPGRRCLSNLDPEQHREWWLNNRVAKYVIEELKAYECETMRTDDVTGIKDVDLEERCFKANKAGAKAFVSIHHNAGINGGSGGGTVVYASRSASAAKKAWQKDVYDRMVKYNGLKGNRSNPLPLKNFVVIVQTNMPALLIECGFMDSKTDVPKILKDEFARQCAKGIAESLADYLQLEKKVAPQKGVTPCTGFCEVVYEGEEGLEVHDTPDLEASSRNREYGPVVEGEVFAVCGKTVSPCGTPMYKLKSSGLYISAVEEFTKYRE